MVGDDALARDVCREFALTHDVRTIVDPEAPGALEEAGIEDAIAVVAVADDDRVNLNAALSVRALNPNVRIVLSQFSRGLGKKLEQNIPNCSVVSPAAHSAATFAAAALDPACFYALEFPEGSGRLAGFVKHRLRELLPLRNISVATAESYVGPILAVNDKPIEDRGTLVNAEDEIVLFRTIERGALAKKKITPGLFWKFSDPIATLLGELDPLVRTIVLFGIGFFVACTIYFALNLRLTWINAAYFVVQTLTTVGYGDITLLDKPDVVKVVGMVMMIGGVVLTNLAVAFLSAALVRTQWIALQGLRRVRASAHVVICGMGRVGTRVVEYLQGFGLKLVIIELQPSPTAVRFGRLRHVSLLTGNAAEDETLDLCDIEKARSVVILTSNDAANLEIGLGIRARQADIPLIMRVNRARFAERVKTQFGIRSIFSPIDLSTQAIVALATSPNARGRLQVGEASFAIQEISSKDLRPPRAVVLASAQDRVLLLDRV